VLRPLFVAAFAAAAWGAAFAAEGVGGYVELVAAQGETQTQDAITGLSLDQTVHVLEQRYRLDFGRRLFPNLTFRIGGSYEVQTTSNELLGETLEGSRKRLAPFARLTLHTPTFGAEAAYDRRQERFEAGPSASKLTQETWRANLSWSPADLPVSRLELSRRNTFDLGRVGLDTVEDRVQLSSRYLAFDKLDLYYRGSVERDVDRINDGRLRSNFQNFRMGYSDAWLDRRVSLSTDYTVNYRSTSTTRSGAGELIEPVVPTAGLATIDETPARDPLAPNPALIDENKTLPAGINLGLPGPGGDQRPRNFGLDLGFATELNTILVWIDRELTPSIAAAFTWRIYTSDDNLDWTLHQTLPSAVFGPFDNRFEIRFSTTVSRYVKIVVSPLSAGIPDATSWPDIEVTELEPSLRRPSSDLSFESSSTTQLVNLDVRALLVPKANFYYELGYFLATRTGGPTTYTLSNGLSVSQALSPILTGAARLSREDRQERLGSQAAYLFSGSLTATPLPTFQASTVASYVQEQGDFGRDTASVTLSGVAQLYRGISANLAVGKSRIIPSSGGSTDAFDVNFGLTLAPNPKFTLNAIVQNRSTDSEFAEAGRPTLHDDLKTAELGASYRPWRSLYLFASQRWERSDVSGSRTLRNYSASWTPFPDGAFHFSVFYDTTYRTEFDETQQTFVPTVRWDITSKIYLNFDYQYLRSTSLLGTSKTEVASATLRAAF
jgi:hypothetical protein